MTARKPSVPPTLAPEVIVGRYVPEPVAQAIHEYLTTRPYAETYLLIGALQQQSTPLTTVPK